MILKKITIKIIQDFVKGFKLIKSSRSKELYIIVL